MTLRELVNCIALLDTMVCPTPDGCLIGVPHSLALMVNGDWHVEYTLPCGTPGCTTFTPGPAEHDPQDVELFPR